MKEMRGKRLIQPFFDDQFLANNANGNYAAQIPPRLNQWPDKEGAAADWAMFNIPPKSVTWFTSEPSNIWERNTEDELKVSTTVVSGWFALPVICQRWPQAYLSESFCKRGKSTEQQQSEFLRKRSLCEMPKHPLSARLPECTTLQDMMHKKNPVHIPDDTPQSATQTDVDLETMFSQWTLDL